MPDLTPERSWLEALEQGRFLLQRRASTGAFIFPPRVAEPRTGATDLEWVAASGAGVVHAVTVIEAAQLRTLYVCAAALPAAWGSSRVIRVSALLRELIAALDAEVFDDGDKGGIISLDLAVIFEIIPGNPVVFL